MPKTLRPPRPKSVRTPRRKTDVVKAPRLTLRIDFGSGEALGPGKIRLLELIAEHGSISAAGRTMDMSYRRAWLLVDNVNTMFAEPAVVTKTGGAGGGTAELTPFGQSLVRAYRSMERKAATAALRQLSALQKSLSRV